MTGKESVIRQFFDYSRKRAAEMGPDSVFNFSIGNPSVPAPDSVTKAMEQLLQNEDPVTLHGYSPTLGLPSTKKAIAESLNRRFGMSYTPELIFPPREQPGLFLMPCGPSRNPETRFLPSLPISRSTFPM